MMRQIISCGLLAAGFMAGLVGEGYSQGAPSPDASESNRTKVFSRTQLQYSGFQNYLVPGVWIDRPLNFDRSLRYPSGTFQHFMEPAFVREIGQVNDYELDGLAAIGSPGGLTMLESALDVAQRNNASNFLMLPEIGSFDGADALIQAALASPYTWRVGGKVVISSYVLDQAPAEQLAPKVATLRASYGDQFLLLADLHLLASRLHEVWNGGPISADVWSSYQAQVRSYLDVFDGILFAGAGDLNLSRPPGRYARQFDAEFYEQALIPLFKSVLSEPAYQNKLLGLSAAKAYICPKTGVNLAEDGTKRLRRSFEAVQAAQPDFIHLPEWNEANENTSFQPTVQNSFATQRIIRHYMRGLKGLPIAPQVGDDLSIPNLILSYRRTAKLGEAVRFEVLNVPDSDKPGLYKIRLALKDPSGATVKSFQEETLEVNKLSDKTFSVPSETLAEYQLLIPSLTVEDEQGRIATFESGFLYQELKPTWNWDYLEVHQPLRDIARMETSLEVLEKSDAPGGALKIKGSVRSDEMLASVEVLENRQEVYAYDHAQEFGDGNKITIKGKIVAAMGSNFSLNGVLTVKDAPSFSLRPWDYANSDLVGLQVNSTGGTFTAQPINTLERGFFLTMTREEAEQAVLDFDLNIGKFQVPVRELLANKAWAKAFPDHVFIALEHYTVQPDIPVHVDAKEVSFTFDATPHSRFPIFHLRAITKSGKVYRSAPLTPWMPNGSNRETLNARSETTGEVVPLQVPSEKILDLNYEFNPDHNAMLSTPAGRNWFGELGGGFCWGESFWGEGRIPGDSTVSNPEWVTEDEAKCLKFDGVGTYLTLPSESLPRGPFALTFEIKPVSPKFRSEVLFRHHGLFIGSLTLKRVSGKLVASFTDSNIRTTDFATGLELPKDQWSRVSVSYDLTQLRFQVDDGVPYIVPFSGEALYIAPSVFGGLTTSSFGVVPGDKFFKGYLRSLQIKHNAL